MSNNVPLRITNLQLTEIELGETLTSYDIYRLDLLLRQSRLLTIGLDYLIANSGRVSYTLYRTRLDDFNRRITLVVRNLRSDPNISSFLRTIIDSNTFPVEVDAIPLDIVNDRIAQSATVGTVINNQTRPIPQGYICNRTYFDDL